MHDAEAPRVVLLLPTGTYRAPDFVAAADALGVEVVVASERRQALAGTMSERALVVPLDDPEVAADRIVAHAATHRVDAVVAVDEGGLRAAALAGERLGLAHNPPDAVAATRDKVELRRRLDAAAVPQPAWRAAAPGDDVAALAAALGLPVVVKAVSLSGSRGVLRADTPSGAQAAAQRVRAILAADGDLAENGDLAEDGDAERLLVERFVPGREVAVEGLLDGGRLEVLAVFDKPDPMDGPTFEETYLVTPSRLPEPVLARVADVTAAACAAVGLVEGPVHAELRVDGDAVAFLEVAARSIGGLCARTLRFGTGASLEEVILRHAVGLDTAGLRRERAAAGVVMLPIPRAGTLLGVEGREKALAVPGVESLELTIPAGRPVRPLPEGDRYLGFLFARGERPEDVEAALRAAHEHLDVRIS